MWIFQACFVVNYYQLHKTNDNGDRIYHILTILAYQDLYMDNQHNHNSCKNQYLNWNKQKHKWNYRSKKYMKQEYPLPECFCKISFICCLIVETCAISKHKLFCESFLSNISAYLQINTPHIFTLFCCVYSYVFNVHDLLANSFRPSANTLK